MSRLRIMGGSILLAAAVLGCGSPTDSPAQLLEGRWLAYNLQVDGVERNLTGPNASGLGQLDFSPGGSATVWFWFDGHLANIPWPNQWRTEGSVLLIGADLALQTDFSPTFSVTRTTLTLTFEEPQQNGVRREVWKYSRVTS
jgi:hypothetical protein